MLNRLIR